MNRERWQTVERIFHEANSLEEPELSAYLAEACGPDAMLRAQIESLLAEDRCTPLDIRRAVRRETRDFLRGEKVHS